MTLALIELFSFIISNEMITGTRSRNSLFHSDGRPVSAKMDRANFKGFFEAPNSFKGVRKFHCIQSGENPDNLVFTGDRIFDQVRDHFLFFNLNFLILGASKKSGFYLRIG